MPAKVKVDDLRCFDEEEFLYLCTKGAKDQLEPPTRPTKRYDNGYAKLDRLKKDFGDDIADELSNIPNYQTEVFTVPDRCIVLDEETPGDVEYGREGTGNENELSEVSSIHSVSNRRSDSDHIDHRTPSSCMMQGQEDTQPILARIDGRTGEFCVQMGGHSYPIEIGELEPSSHGNSKWAPNLQFCHAASSDSGSAYRMAYFDVDDTLIKKTSRTHFKDVIYRSSDRQRGMDLTQLNDKETPCLQEHCGDVQPQITGQQARDEGACVYLQTVNDSRDCMFKRRDCEYDQEVVDREIIVTRNGESIYGIADNQCEQKWFENLAQYSDGMSRFVYGPYCLDQYKQVADFTWEPDCALSRGTSPPCVELPPVSEVLPKNVDSVYVNGATVLRHDVTLNDPGFRTSCITCENETKMGSCMLQSRTASRSRVPTGHTHNTIGPNGSFQRDMGSKNRNKADDHTNFSGLHCSQQLTSQPTYRRDPLNIELKKQMKKLKRGCRLWEFIRNLLLDPSTNPSLIRWENRDEGTFKLVQSKAIAYKWGMKKGNGGMTYEKLSRAMRYYYKRQVFQPVLGKRLVYRFGPRATGWRGDK